MIRAPRRPFHPYSLAARTLAAQQGNAARWHPEEFGEIANELRVGLPFDRRRGDADLERIPVKAHNFAFPGAGLRVHRENQRQRCARANLFAPAGPAASRRPGRIQPETPAR